MDNNQTSKIESTLIETVEVISSTNSHTKISTTVSNRTPFYKTISL